MIEELVKQLEKEFETNETEPADETDVQETEQTAMDNVETDETETDETQKPVSLVQSLVAELEKELMTDVPAESDQLDDEPSDETEDVESDDETEPSADEQETDDDEQETDDEQDEIVKALEWQEKIKQAEQRASESERKARQLAMSYLLQSRDDITDIRLVASLIGDVNKIEMGEGETLEEAISRKINETVKRYPSLVKDGKKEYRTVMTNEGISVQSEVKPIGKPSSRAQDEPFNTKAELLEEMKERAEKSGDPADRVRYLSKAREWGLL